MSVNHSVPAGTPAKDDEADQKRPADEGASAQAPAEGADDVEPPLPGSPRG